MEHSIKKQEILLKHQLSTKPLFTVKLADFGKSYLELDHFRQQIEWDKKCLEPMPFTAAKRKVLTYKSIFLALGLLFLVLGAFIYMRTFALPFTYFLLGTFYIAKNLVCGFCGMAGTASLLISHSLRTDREIVGHIIRKGRRNLSKLYARKKIEHKLNSFMNFGPAYQKSLVLSHTYRETHDKILDLKEETLHLFQRILSADHLNGGRKEHLYNQAVLEMDLRLEEILLNFKETHP